MKNVLKQKTANAKGINVFAKSKLSPEYLKKIKGGSTEKTETIIEELLDG